MAKFCKYCGSELKGESKICDNCGANLEEEKTVSTPSTTNTNPNANPNAKSKIVAGILGIFFGGLGVHNFYLGFNSKAAIQIVVSFLTCGMGSLWGFVEGILILCGTIDKDADGNPLVD